MHKCNGHFIRTSFIVSLRHIHSEHTLLVHIQIHLHSGGFHQTQCLAEWSNYQLAQVMSMSTTVDKRRHSTEVVDLTHDDSDGDLAADQYLLPLDIALPFLRTQVQSHSPGVLLPRAGSSPRSANQKMLTVKREARARDEVDILRCRLLQ